jgi:hypothetical protein
MAIKRIKDNRNIELRPDGWERFRTAVAAAAIADRPAQLRHAL